MSTSGGVGGRGQQCPLLPDLFPVIVVEPAVFFETGAEHSPVATTVPSSLPIKLKLSRFAIYFLTSAILTSNIEDRNSFHFLQTRFS
jgi:hypothetical protein